MTADLEAVIWRQFRAVNADRHDSAPRAVDVILRAVETYADRREHLNAAARLAALQRDTPDKQAERRSVLRRPS
jgi:hypothetical protein